MNNSIPRFVSVVAVALGLFDLLRGIMHTVLVGFAAVDIAGLDLSGPTGHDQVTLMTAFGASNLITGVALILLGFTNRQGVLVLLATILAAYALAGLGLSHWGSELTGQGLFPGVDNMRIYLAVCVVTLIAGLAGWWRNRNQDEDFD